MAVMPASSETTTHDEPPLASILLIAFNQQATVGAAIEAALAQTYTPLEVVISDDASSDETWAEIVAAAQRYGGPHRVVLNRNPSNLGIGAHLSHLVGLSSGEMLFVAAGDDVSMPHRCERVMAAWLASGKQLDLIASRLIDIDASGAAHGEIVPSDLATYRSPAEWVARPPHVVGAAQAWTRRLFDRFGGLPAGVVAEDLIMVFRAIGSGGAITLPEALVGYRRGGVSRRVRNLSAAAVVERLLKNNRHAVIELGLLLADARALPGAEGVIPVLQQRLERELFIERLFAARTQRQRLRVALGPARVSAGLRLRMGIYALCPWVLAPFFAVKRWLATSG
jgi:glycosyltransferase involved in cell wall biosynthesis